MDMKQMHLNTINKVQQYISSKDFEGLKQYIEKREKEVRDYREDTTSEYIEELVKDLI